MTWSTAQSILDAGSPYPSARNIKAALRMEAIGLAIPLPVMSGAEPCTLEIFAQVLTLRWNRDGRTVHP